TERKTLLSFRDGDTIQAYLAGLPGAGLDGFPVRMRVPDTEFVSPVLVCAESLLEVRFVDRWGVGLTQWTAAPRRRRSDRTPALNAVTTPEGQRGSRVTQLAAHYRDRLSLIRDSDLSSGDQESFTRSVRLHIDHMLETIRRMIAVTGRHIDELSPMVDARLPDGSRVNAIIRPAALRGPSLTIRKFRDFVMDIDDLLREGSLSPAMAEFLRACVLGRMNILVSGGTGSGKTTSLNVMASYIPENQRVVTIEDAAELQIQHPHVVSLEHRP